MFGRHGKGRTATPGAEAGIFEKHENRGNEAKKWLKTKDITFLMLQFTCVFACKLAPITP